MQPPHSISERKTNNKCSDVLRRWSSFFDHTLNSQRWICCLHYLTGKKKSLRFIFWMTDRMSLTCVASREQAVWNVEINVHYSWIQVRQHDQDAAVRWRSVNPPNEQNPCVFRKRSKGLKVSLISDEQCFNTSLLCAAVCDSLHPKIESNKMDFFSCWTNQVPAKSFPSSVVKAAHHTQGRAGQTTDCECFYFCFSCICLFVCLCAFGWKSTVSPLSWHHECPHTTRMTMTTTRCFWKPAHRLHSCSLRACTHAYTSRRLHFWGTEVEMSTAKKKKEEDNSELETAPSFFMSSSRWWLWRSSLRSHLQPVFHPWLQLTYPCVYSLPLTAMLYCTLPRLTGWLLIGGHGGSWPVSDIDALCDIIKYSFFGPA